MALQLPATAADYRRLARSRLPGFLFDYVDGGASDEKTLEANLSGWAEINLRQRVLVNVDRVDTAATLAGQPCSMPLALGPVGFAGMMARRGEAQAALAAEAVGVPFTLSTVGICPLAEVTKAVGAQAIWFQLYMLRDRAVVQALLQRAWDAGCRTLVFTVDLPVSGMRHRDTRNGLDSGGAGARLIRAQQLLSRPSWLWDVGVRGGPHSFGSLVDHVAGARDMDAFKTWLDAQFDPGVTWTDIDWLRGQWKGALLLKGVLDVEDAQAAVRAGVEGVIVSNHGGRQLDGVASTAAKLPAIVRAVGRETEVLVDGGVRSGVDVFRAVALGARGVLIGRPWVWALAAAGQRGVTDLLTRWRRELLLAMTLTGATSLAEVDLSRLDRS